MKPYLDFMRCIPAQRGYWRGPVLTLQKALRLHLHHWVAAWCHQPIVSFLAGETSLILTCSSTQPPSILYSAKIKDHSLYSFLKNPAGNNSFFCIRLSIGNSIISSAITDKQARVSFYKLQNSTSPKDECYLRFLKTHECLFSVIAREIILLLINNIKRKCPNKHFVLTTSHYASALILEFLRLKNSCLQKPWLKVLCTKFQHTLEFVL